MPSATVPPPLDGWNTFDALVGMQGNFAPVLDNLLPEQGRMLMRAGYRSWATGLPGRVDGLMAYRSGSATFLFAASGSGIYDVTSGGAVGAAVVGGLTSAAWDGLMVAAAGGNFLLAFNGVDAAQQFNGTTWATWTGTGAPVPTWAGTFKSQLFVGNRTALSFWYAAPAAIGGALTEFPLQGVATKGGGVAGMIAWTHDGGTGPDDYAVFVTTEGEVLIFKGTNPSSSTTWALVGVFSLPRPLGTRFLRPFGGDILLLTEGGVFPLSALTSGNTLSGVSGADAAALSAKAFTRRIEPTFIGLARGRLTQAGWELVPLTSYGLWLVNVPWGASDAQQITFRAVSGACCRFTGIAAACWIESGGRTYFGHASAGSVMLWGEDEDDAGLGIKAECVQAFADYGAPGALKRFTMLQPILSDAAGAVVQASMALDWSVPRSDADIAGAGAPKVSVDPGLLVWGSGNWGEKNWAGDAEITRAWQGISGIGMSGAIRLRLTSSSGRVGWLGSGIVWERGGPLR